MNGNTVRLAIHRLLNIGIAIMFLVVVMALISAAINPAIVAVLQLTAFLIGRSGPDRDATDGRGRRSVVRSGESISNLTQLIFELKSTGSFRHLIASRSSLSLRTPRKLDQAAERDRLWFFDQLDSVKKDYPDQFVAVYDRRIVATGNTLDELLDRVDQLEDAGDLKRSVFIGVAAGTGRLRL